MKLLSKSLNVFLLLITFTQISFAANTVTRNYTVKEFNELKAESAFKVEFIHSDENKVIIEIDEDAVDNVYVANEGEKLVIKLKEYNKYNINTMKAKVYGNSLSGISVSGASNFSSTYTFNEKNINIKAAGASKMEISIKTETLTADISGASKVTVKGDADKQTVYASGASHYDGKECKSNDVDITASGASKAIIDCKDSLDAKASGASHISYISTPKNIERIETGAGSIKMN